LAHLLVTKDSDLKKKLGDELKQEVSAASENRVTETLVIALTALASNLWKLSEEVKDETGHEVDSDRLPPNLSQTGIAHVTMARRLLADLLIRLRSVSDEFLIRPILKRAKLEVGQAWAYHTATLGHYARAGRSNEIRAPQISEEEWDDALKYSAEAFAALDEYRGELVYWLDTYLYVRVMHIRNFPRAESSRTEAQRAFARYRTWRGAENVAARFRAEFE
jgi:hypothetical protein